MSQQILEQNYFERREVKERKPEPIVIDYSEFVERRYQHVYCKLCNMRIKNMVHFELYHAGLWSQKFVAQLQTGGVVGYNFKMRPMERQYFIDRIKYDPTKRRLLKGVVVSYLILEEIEYGVQEDAMTVFSLVGIPESGKSTVGLTIARHIQHLWNNRLLAEGYLPSARIWITFNYAQTTQIIHKCTKGDTVLQDEDPRLSGKESRTIKMSMSNLLKIMRKACISFLFASPVPTGGIMLPNMYIETIAKDKPARVTLMVIYDRAKDVKGYGLIKVVPKTDPILVWYEDKKDINIEGIQSAGGLESVGFTYEKIFADMKKLYAKIRDINIHWESEKIDAYVLERYIKLAHIRGSVFYTSTVMMFAVPKWRDRYEILDMARKPKDTGEDEDLVTVEKVDSRISVEEIRVISKDMPMLDLIYECVPEAVAKLQDRGEGTLRKYKPKFAKAWHKHFYGGVPYTELAAYFDGITSDTVFSNTYNAGGWVPIFQKEVSGEAHEIAAKKRYYPGYQHIGGKDQPDLVSRDSVNWVEAKLRSKTPLKPKHYVTKLHVKHLESGGNLNLLITYYGVSKKRGPFCEVSEYKITLTPQYKDSLKQGE